MISTITNVVVAVALAIGVFRLVAALWDRSRLARRVQMAGGVTSVSVESRLVEGAAGLSGVMKSVLARLGEFMPLGQEDRLKIATSLGRAGFQSSDAVTVVLGAKVACLLSGLIVGTITLSGFKPGLLGWLIGIGGGFLIGVILNTLPEMIVAQIAKRRIWELHAALPDALDLLIVCMEAGLTFERALRRVVNDLKTFRPSLASELGQASTDMNVHGRTRDDALGRIANRLESQDFRDLATTVAQSERHGTPVADSLRKLAQSLRIEAIARTQARMARLPTLLVMPAIGGMLPGILIIVGGPAVIGLMDELKNF